MADWIDALIPAPEPEAAADRARRLEQAGELAAALEAYEAALAETPGEVDLLCSLARIAGRLEMPAQALALWHEVEAREPGRLDALDGRARALADLRRQGEAVELLRAAILARPHEARLWNALGILVNEGGDSTAAHAFFDEAVRLEPEFAAARYHRGDVRFDLGRLAEAEGDFDAAARHAHAPEDVAVIAFARVLLQLHRGELAAGWDGYDVRLASDHPNAPVFEGPAFEAPRWTPDTPLEGARLLVVAEQGLGDEIMFLGLVPDVLAALGPRGSLIVALEPRLCALAARSFPTALVLPHATERRAGRGHRSIPRQDRGSIDGWAPLASLPRRFRRTAQAFAPARAYLQPDPARVARWRAWLGDAPSVGISWRSGLSAGRRARHTPELAAWAPVLRREGVRFVHLQYGAEAAELAALDALSAMPLLRPEIDLKNDLDELAALCTALDLVVSVPNATAALGAACGAETWFLATPNPWPQLGTDGYPWYSRAWAFNAIRFGDWAPVLKRVERALKARFTPAAGG